MSLTRLSSALGRSAAALASVLALAACNIQFGTGIEATETWTRNYAVNATATLEVVETNGRVHVTAGDVPDIRVTATKHAKGPTEEAAKAAAKEMTIKDVATADRVTLDGTTKSQLTSGESRWVDYDITVPLGASVTIKKTNGEIKVRDIGGLVKMELVNGEVEGVGLRHGADVSAINGDIRLEMAAIGSAGVRGKMTNGEFVVTLARDAKATVSARVINGDIDVSNLPIAVERRRLEAPLNGGGPEIRLDVTNGAIRLVGR